MVKEENHGHLLKTKYEGQRIENTIESMSSDVDRSLSILSTGK